MKTFDEVWKVTDKIPGNFSRRSAEKLYEFAQMVPQYGYVVEVGVDQGRSASLLLEAQRDRMYSLYLIDAWEVGPPDNMEKVQKLREQFGGCVNIMKLKSVEAALSPEQFGTDYCLNHFDLIHIDAYHFDNIDDGGPSLDCAAWMPKVKSGGVACFHDYNSCFPDVNKAVDKYCAGWEDLGDWDGLAIRRKP